MKLRGYLALLVICAVFPLCDLWQRTVVALRLKLNPARRIEILGPWINRMAALVMGTITRVGGASVPEPERVVPTGPGILIVMNHQSLLDIPLVVQTVGGGYPRIVTRARYHRFIPLISHMVRLYQYPVVDPSANARELVRSIEMLEREAVTSDVPIAIFPEGTRTKDGEIGRFKRSGLRKILKARAWTIHVFVADGFWRTAKFRDFLSGMDYIDGRRAYLGRLDWADPGADPDELIDEMRAMMLRGLRELRSDAVNA